MNNIFVFLSKRTIHHTVCVCEWCMKINDLVRFIQSKNPVRHMRLFGVYVVFCNESQNKSKTKPTTSVPKRVINQFSLEFTKTLKIYNASTWLTAVPLFSLFILLRISKIFWIQKSLYETSTTSLTNWGHAKMFPFWRAL